MRTRRILVACLLVPAVAASFWSIPKFLQGSEEPGLLPLLQRVRPVQVGTPFDDEKLLSGEAIYREAIHMSGSDSQVKVQVRTERRYAGPMPTESELAELLDRGLADSLAHLLREPFSTEISSWMMALEKTLGQLAHDIDLETEAAKRDVRSSPDQLAVELGQADSMTRRNEVLRIVRAAKRGEERFVAEIGGKTETWFRLRKQRFPRLFELQEAETEALALRREFLAAQVHELLAIQGVAALEPALFAPSPKAKP
jgi:hypothetical protein